MTNTESKKLFKLIKDSYEFLDEIQNTLVKYRDDWRDPGLTAVYKLISLNEGTLINHHLGVDNYEELDWVDQAWEAFYYAKSHSDFKKRIKELKCE